MVLAVATAPLLEWKVEVKELWKELERDEEIHLVQG
jgi:hypothetical protein